MPIETSMYGMQPATKLDPGAAISMAQGMQGLKASQFDLITKQMNTVRNTLGSLAQDPDVTPEKVQAAGALLVQQGLVQPQQLQGFMQGLQGRTGADLRGALANHLATMIDAHTNYTNAYGGQAGAIDTNDQTYLTRNAPRTGISVQGNVSRGIDPLTQATPVAGPQGPRGEQTQESFAARARANGLPMPSGGITGPGVRNNLTGGGPSAVGPGVNPLVGAVVAPSGAGVAMPAAPAAPVAPAPAASAPRVMTAPVGRTEALASTAAASAGQGNDLQKAADAAQQSKAILADMEKHAEGLALGPASPMLRKGGAIVNQVAGAAGYKEPLDFVKHQEQFTKLAEQLRQQQAKALSGTDASLSSAGASTPNETYSAEGVRGMIASLKGNQDAINVKNQEWQKWKQKNGPDSYGDFQQDFNSKFDPRVFQLVYLKPEERVKTVKSLDPGEQKKVAAAYQAALDNGWVKPLKGQ